MTRKSNTTPLETALARPQPASRTEAVQEALRQAIIEQKLQPGARLPEDALGETFGTSRTIAREAVNGFKREERP